ncbi:MAG: hypothetical protein J0L70_18365 [Leptolyngbya sp. UWPOB_LEPTO1]|uniref:hypothetical protein n=1 Tax=Leptolyngbya sp. UWPOB_LEPTO1 TaxID=2815653 RepID=UPI001AC28F62|nr:hypothetical protein [Leptolyngbya sp. UWPOB_LEPTO1]MBN8562500.1 hypothetical protein [Leptolyngbya sp. UWPOB_LEPTO1]
MTNDVEKLIAEMYLNQQKLMAEVQALRLRLEGHPAISDGWMTAKEAAIALQTHGIKSPKQLQNLRLDGAFNESKGEIRNVGKGETPRWLYHVPNCRKALERRYRAG